MHDFAGSFPKRTLADVRMLYHQLDLFTTEYGRRKKQFLNWMRGVCKGSFTKIQKWKKRKLHTEHVACKTTLLNLHPPKCCPWPWGDPERLRKLWALDFCFNSQTIAKSIFFQTTLL